MDSQDFWIALVQGKFENQQISAKKNVLELLSTIGPRKAGGMQMQSERYIVQEHMVKILLTAYNELVHE